VHGQEGEEQEEVREEIHFCWWWMVIAWASHLRRVIASV
jgi:hypothetical protein